MKWKISKKSLTCTKCGHILNQDEIKSVKSGVPISCHQCGHALTIERHLKSPEHDDRNYENSVVHPVGRLSVSQRVQPLDVEIQKFGDNPDEDNGESHDYFAPAAFRDMSASEKLNTPSFEKLDTMSFEKVCPYCGHKNKSGSSVCETCSAAI